MADLPPVPDLDLDASSEDTLPALPAPTLGDPIGSNNEPLHRPPPPPPGEARTGPPTSPSPPRTTDTNLQDSIEEVLQQTSAQTLQLSRIDDSVEAFNQTLNDVREEMHAGFVEVRSVAESANASSNAPTAPGAGASESLTQRLDFVEEQVLSANRRQSLIFIFGVIQTILLAVVLVVVLLSRSGHRPEPPVALSPAPPSATSDTDITTQPLPTDNSKRAFKKSRRRRR